MFSVKKITGIITSIMVLAAGTTALAVNIHVNTLNGSEQMILAETSSTSSSYATIAAYEESGQGNWVLKKKTTGRVGSKGIEPIESRKQGTNKTPAGIMRLQAAFGQTDNPGTLFPYHKITNNMYWDLNSGSKNYNRLVYSNPGGDYEQLIKYKTYKYMFTTDYNTEQVKGKGGAIFLHCNGSGATSGCVSMPEEDMKWCMTWLDPEKSPSLIVTTTQDKYKYLTPDKTTVTATYIADTGNRISWTDADGAARYMIQKTDKPNGTTYETVHTASAGENSWMDADGSKKEYYRVVTSNIIDGKTGFTAVSNVVSPQMPFEDVAYNAYYYDAVVWASEAGVTSGTSPKTFSPENGCTRAQAVQMIYNYVGRPDTDDMEMPFTDVSSDAWYADAVNWAFNVGVVAGTSETTFSPNDTCTRAQIVQMLWHQQGSEKVATSSEFTDVSSNDWFYNAVNWAAEKQVTSGTSATTFSPRNMCTRGQIVTFISKCFN